MFNFKRLLCLDWIISSFKEVLGEAISWIDGDAAAVTNEVENVNCKNEVSIFSDPVSQSKVKLPRHNLPNELKGDVTTFGLPFMVFMDVYDNIALNNSKKIYHKMRSNGDIFCGEENEIKEITTSYLYEECLDKCNMKEMNQVACFLMLVLNGRVKCEKEKKKNMLNLIKKFVNFCRYFTDEQCKGMSYPINLLCLIYRKNEYLRENGLERSLIPLDAEMKYLKKAIAEAAHNQDL
uniref:Uncharacterized protein n=1 Tax=Panagrolaimus sp. PS1159 TaxID=55785 RepID=A0AC35FX98_9BILA